MAAHAEVATKLREAIAKGGSKTNAVAKAGYFKHVAEFAGVPAPELRSIVKSIALPFAMTNPPGAVELAKELLQDPVHEVKAAGVSVLSKVRAALGTRQLPATRIAQAVSLRSEHPEVVATSVSMVQDLIHRGSIRDWATCDALAGSVFFHVLHDEGKRVIWPCGTLPTMSAVALSWSEDTAFLWAQRLACVSFVKLGRRGLLHSEALACAHNAVCSHERFVQLGAGWCVRDVGEADEALATKFIREHLPQWSREGLRYATEKLPRAVAAPLLDEHMALSRRAPKRARESS
jgi:3-methyladenine DNA glycosylase AlkD